MNNLHQFSGSDNRLTGPIPKSFVKLSELGTLDLSNNELISKIPEGIQAWKKLNELTLANKLKRFPQIEEKIMIFLGISNPSPKPPIHASAQSSISPLSQHRLAWVSSSIQALGFSGFHRRSRRCLPQPIALVFRRSQESKYLKDTPVVIMSSENMPSRINRCLEEGAEEFFLKPVQLSDVNKLKTHLLKGRDKESEPNINKRKGMEECHSHDKTRIKYDGLEVV
ncbi:hypothetical protein CMV_018594 [Castanea mollissima]|uniref:Response regulatory domain-containing protein n=1 Tax=Castanea mollissima TaxID=60419 RepID=A0A8J4VG22_9ROSI|nr:hypothetical protein CMV_018594 [Castanea mollissima]